MIKLSGNFAQIILVTFLFTSPAFSQDSPFEILYLEEDYDGIIDRTEIPKDAHEVYWHALAQKNIGETLQAIETIENWLDQPAEHLLAEQLERLLAECYFSSGQLAKAEPLLLKYRQYESSFNMVVRAYELKSNYYSAVELLEEKLAADSLNVSLLENLADNYMEIEKELSARDLYIRSLEINPENVVVLAKLANIQLKMQDYWPAINSCERGLGLDSTNATLMKLKGIGHFRLGNYPESEESFESLLASGDSSIAVLKHLGISEVKEYRFMQAIEHLYWAYRQDTADYEICYFLGSAFHNAELPDSGLYYLDLANKLLEPKPAVLAVINAEKAQAYAQKKAYQTAVDHYKEACSLKARPEYFFFIGSLYQNRLHDKSNALKYYTEFISQLPPLEQGQQIELDSRSVNQRKAASMRELAEKNIEILKEELFFEGDNSLTDPPN